MNSNYIPNEIEPRWQREWEEQGQYRADESGGKPKYYCLDFFPYPSGDGLHVGHCRNYVPTDVLSRYKRMRGFNVLHPMGWDSFGEPAEQFAIANGVHPRLTTDQNTANYRRQMTLVGCSYDWSREIDSSRPEFYRWTQWFFLSLYRRGLAYRDTNWQWWCPTCQTTLSSHEAVGGQCWRGHSGVTRREIPAWYFRITAYADRLLDGLNEIDWPESIKTMQRNWIGRSEGCEIDFRTEAGEVVPVFTTRPDTVYGATFFVLAPEHPLVKRVTSEEQRARVEAYSAAAARLSEIERQAEARQKTGVFTGGYVVNPLSGERIPVWIGDYVLPTYGTGAVMGVPAHDERDYEFARAYGLPIRRVIARPGEEQPGEWDSISPVEAAYTGEGVLVNSGPFNGLSSVEAIESICDYLEGQDLGRRKVQYRMRDWLISRQRYWGTPIPILYCEACGERPVPEEQLPVLLPEMADFQPDGSGRSPLARLPEFTNTTCPECGGPAKRETDTMGGFACSSWYFLRFTSPQFEHGPFEPQAMNYWMPVDLYVGGAEHAVLHLLYSRFWTHAMADAGLLPFCEPFPRLMNQGQLLASDGLRMSKSRGNVISPDGMVTAYGADALRVYELFMAPFDQDVTWSEEGIHGARRFLNRVWGLYAGGKVEKAETSGEDRALEKALHKTIRQVSERIEGFRFNTAVSALMEFTNLMSERKRAGAGQTSSFQEAQETFLVLLAPFAPHIAEELWHRGGHRDSIHQQAWPAWDEDLAREDSLQVAVQVDGKVRAVLAIDSDAGEETVKEQALAHPKVQQHLAGREVTRSIYVPGKILSFSTHQVEQVAG
jgi:leucyl-tRNA synthetase